MTTTLTNLAKRASAATSGNGRWVPGTPYVGLVATRGKAPTNGGVPGVACHMSRSIHTARGNITSLQIALANWFVSISGEVAAGGFANTKAAVEYPLNGGCTQIKFGGAVQGTMLDYQTILSDPTAIAIPDGAPFAIREWRDYPSGGSVTFTNQVGIDANGGNCYTYGAAGSQADLTMTPGPFAGGDGASFSMPVAIVGPTSMSSYILIGDSRGEGYGDLGNGNADVGWLARSVGPKRAYTNLGKYGELTSTAANVGFRQRAAIIQRWGTNIISEYGINDIYGNSSSADNLILMIDTIRQRFPNKWFYQTSMMGETGPDGVTAVDAYKDLFRQWFNNYGRSGMHAWDGFFDATLAVETGPNTNKWKAGMSDDGLHPNQAGYAAIAASGIIKVY